MTKKIQFAIGLMLLAAAPVLAQPHKCRVDVPFAFSAVGKTWAPGTYILQVEPISGTLTVFGNNNERAMVKSTRTDVAPLEESYVRFKRYGTRWALAAIVLDGDVNTVPPGGLEKELIAKNKPSNDKILIARAAK